MTAVCSSINLNADWIKIVISRRHFRNKSYFLSGHCERPSFYLPSKQSRDWWPIKILLRRKRQVPKSIKVTRITLLSSFDCLLDNFVSRNNSKKIYLININLTPHFFNDTIWIVPQIDLYNWYIIYSFHFNYKCMQYISIWVTNISLYAAETSHIAAVMK